MATFFDQFPRIFYNITGNRLRQYETVTEIMFRIGIIRETLNNISAYFTYTISDSETPEILASEIYGNPEAYWMILYANNILDPQYDWPMNSDVFYAYMVDKYRPMAEEDAGQDQTDSQVIAWTKANNHHYEKIVERTNRDVITTQSLRVDEANLTSNLASSLTDVPYDHYDNLPETQSVYTYSVSGDTVTEIIRRNAISYYDYEDQENENKRFIKIIKPEYYETIMQEYEQLVNPTPTYVRRL